MAAVVKLHTIPGVHAVTTYTLVPRDLTPTTRNHVVAALQRGYIAGHPSGSVTHRVISALSSGLAQKFERPVAMPVYGYPSEFSTRDYPQSEVCWPYGMIKLVEPELADLRKELEVTYQLIKAKSKTVPIRKQFVPDLTRRGDDDLRQVQRADPHCATPALVRRADGGEG